ncbi:MAG: pentapeptide repeat-containing protein [Streptosporangiaceae bacterium]
MADGGRAVARPASRPAELQARLRADCSRCFALCCAGPGFTASAEFAITKPAGQPCPNLAPDFRCSIHPQLRERGFAGCARYDCFGAGQHVAQVVFAGRDWRTAPQLAGQMFSVFAVVRQLHELAWYLAQAIALPAAAPRRGQLRAALAATLALAQGTPDELAGLAAGPHWQQASALLSQASELARAAVPGPHAQLRGADLAGADLRETDLRGASLRGACLIGARLAGADLTGADLTGADLRDADLRGADLRGSLFLSRGAVDAARTDASTRLPQPLASPAPTPRRPWSSE